MSGYHPSFIRTRQLSFVVYQKFNYSSPLVVYSKKYSNTGIRAHLEAFEVDNQNIRCRPKIELLVGMYVVLAFGAEPENGTTKLANVRCKREMHT